MFKNITITGFVLALSLALGLTLTVDAQSPFYAPPSAMDAVSGMSVGPSPGAYMPQQPARNNNNYGAPANSPYAVAPPSEFEGMGFDPNNPNPMASRGATPPPNMNNFAGTPPPGGFNNNNNNAAAFFGPGAVSNNANFGATNTGFGDPNAGFGTTGTAMPVVNKVTVVSGERLYDNFTRELLEEAMVDEVPETEVTDEYYDDGSHNDAAPNDSIYTNVTDNYDYVGQMTHKLRTRYTNLIFAAEALDPIDFFGLLATTNNPLSSINQELVEEGDRDDRLRAWNVQFLAFARMNPDDEKSELYPLFVPRMPKQPEMPLPYGYDPRPPKQEEEPGFNGLTPGDYASGYWEGEGGAAGAPVGNASSRYF